MWSGFRQCRICCGSILSIFPLPCQSQSSNDQNTCFSDWSSCGLPFASILLVLHLNFLISHQPLRVFNNLCCYCSCAIWNKQKNFLYIKRVKNNAVKLWQKKLFKVVTTSMGFWLSYKIWWFKFQKLLHFGYASSVTRVGGRLISGN